MDCFRISHEAYHELCMVSKGHLPPLGRLSKEKKIMSEEIPYEKHPKVGIIVIVFHSNKVISSINIYHIVTGGCN